MTEVNKNIIDLINSNLSMKEICKVVGITEKQFYVRLKQLINYGYQIKPNYRTNSNIYYEINKKIVKDSNNEVKLTLSNSDKDFRCIVISDVHFGNVDSDIRLLSMVYNYASKENINVILFCGDMLDGIYTTQQKSIKDKYEQIETFIKKYPYDKNINNFGILGNHEYHFLHYDGIDISKKITDARYDIVILGYGDGLIKIKNDSLLLRHHLSVVDNTELEENSNIVLSGHGHMMKTKLNGVLNLCIPSLSYLSPDKTKEVVPGFLDMKLDIEKGKFKYLQAKHMIITPKILEASETRCNIKVLK